jgi:hypothetical protein
MPDASVFVKYKLQIKIYHRPFDEARPKSSRGRIQGCDPRGTEHGTDACQCDRAQAAGIGLTPGGQGRRSAANE